MKSQNQQKKITHNLFKTHHSLTGGVNYAAVNDHMAIGGMKSTGEKQVLPSKSCPTVTSPQKIDKYITSDNVENYLKVRPKKKWYGNLI